ncbi:MAG: DUF305 domain-containing protein [Candidatus Paceibacterota bacterium]
MNTIKLKFIALSLSFFISVAFLFLVLHSKSNRFNDEEYARMMSVHHAQAVDLSLHMLLYGNDPVLKVIATDILLTQQNQVGRFQQFLDERGARRVLAAGVIMDGMLNHNELRTYKELRGRELDLDFIDLMIRHHEGGVLMSKYSVSLGLNGQMARLAKSAILSQQAELQALVEVKNRVSGG